MEKGGYISLYRTYNIGPIVLHRGTSGTEVTGPGTQVTISRLGTMIARSTDKQMEVRKSGGEVN